MKEIQRYEMNHKGLPELDDNGVWVLKEDHAAIVATLQEQVLKLAAENAALAPFIHLMIRPETPATDSVIREIGAKAVEGFGIYHNFSNKLFIQQETQKYAAKIRAGELS